MRRHPKAPAVGSTLGSGSSRARFSGTWPGLALVLIALAAMALAPAAQAAPTRVELPALSKLSAAGTGNIETGSDLVKGVATTTGTFEIGQYFTGGGFAIPSGTKIIAIPSATELKLSANSSETVSGVSISSSWVESFACGTATDAEGNYYVGSGAGFGTTRIAVYKSDGTLITELVTTGPTCNLAVDSLGRIYATRYSTSGTGGAVMRYAPSALPVTASTTYAPDTSLNGTGELLTSGAYSVAVNPADNSVVVSRTGINEKQTFNRPIPSECSPVTTFTLTFEAATTSTLTCATAGTSPSNATIAAALNALPTIGGVGGTVAVTSSGAAKTVEFKGTLGSKNIPAEAITVKKSNGEDLSPPQKSGTAADGAPSRIASYQPNGSLINETTGNGVSAANYLDVDVYGANGRIYATDAAHNKALVFEAGASTPLKEIDGSGSAACTKGAFTGMGQAPLAVDQSNGSVLVSDIAGHGVVDEFNAAGKCIATIARVLPFEEAGQAGGIAVDRSSTASKGNAYILSSGGNGKGAVYAYDAPVQTRALTTSVTPGGSGTVLCNGTSTSNPLASCASSYTEESSIALNAVPSAGFKFKEWKSGTGSAAICNGSTNSTCTVELAANSEVTAEFELAGFKLLVSKNGTGSGKVTSAPAGIDCGSDCDETFAESTLVSLTPAPDPGSSFKAWGGDCAGSGACEVTMSAAKNVSATFVAAPSVTTTAGGTNITPKKANVAGTVNPNGTQVDAASCKVQYGETISYGQSAPCAPADPGAGSSPVAVTASLSGLNPGTIYHFRFTSSNEGGTNVGNGSDQTFVTAALFAPVVETKAATGIGKSGATMNGSVNPKLENVTDCKFEYGLSAPAYGQTAPCVPANPGSGNSPVDVSAAISGLSPDTTYHFRLVATNAGGTTNGSDLTLKTAADEKPAVTGLTPSKGPTAGTNQVIIAGINFTGATEVKFGGASATFTVDGPTQIKATAPSGSAGGVDVIVTTPEGSSTNTAADDYTYLSAPSVTAVNPNKGPLTAGTAVTVTGSNLQEASFKFGANPATSVVVNGPGTSATMNAPAGSAGTVDVIATTLGGSSTNSVADDFTYLAAPTLSSCTPNKGPLTAGTAVTCTGTNLAEASFKFGANPATSVIVNGPGTSATMSAPAGSAGTVDVIATTLGGSSTNTTADNYTYEAVLPSVTAVNPNKGPLTAGAAVTVTGTNLSGASFKFGANPATSVVVNGPGTSATMNAPAGIAGTVDVIATTLEGSSTNTVADDYTYLSPPTVTAVNPNKGPTTGGNVVTITGTNLSEASFKFGAGTATEVNITGGGTGATVKAPAGSPSTVSIIATTLGGSSTNTAADDYTYVVAPTVTAVSPSKGPTTGGNVVTITGTNLSEASFKFGANAATEVNITGGGTGATVKAPAGSAGIVSVIATIPGGVSANTALDDYAYLAPSALTIEKAGSGSGSVSCDGGPCAASYPYGAKVTLTASPAQGSSFAGWSGSGCSGTGSCLIAIEADAAVTATFTASPVPPPPPPPTPEGKGTPKVAASAPVSGGKAALTISCTGSGPCKGTLKLTAKIDGKKKTIGSSSYDLAAGKSATVKVKLSAAAKKLLKEGKTVKATLSGSGVKGTVKLKPAKKKGGK